jgi:DNA-binding NtrC family response regulator
MKLLGRSCFHAVFCDLKTPGLDSMGLLGQIRQRNPEVAIVVVTKPEDLRLGILAMMSGASDYIHASLNPHEVLASLNRALNRKRLELAITNYRHTPANQDAPAALVAVPTVDSSLTTVAS